MVVFPICFFLKSNAPFSKPEEEVMLSVLENGALDFIENEDNYEIYTNSDDLLKVHDGLVEIGVTDFITSEITFVSDNLIELDEEKKEIVLELIENLEDIDDVQNVYHNLSM